jgi:hypothetical protein
MHGWEDWVCPYRMNPVFTVADRRAYLIGDTEFLVKIRLTDVKQSAPFLFAFVNPFFRSRPLYVGLPNLR